MKKYPRDFTFEDSAPPTEQEAADFWSFVSSCIIGAAIAAFLAWIFLA